MSHFNDGRRSLSEKGRRFGCLLMIVAGAVCSAPAYGSTPPDDPSASGASLPPALPTERQPVAAPVYDEILGLAPADAWVIAYTDNGEATMRHTLVDYAVRAGARSSVLVRTVASAFDGPTMLAVSGVPINPVFWRVTLAARTKLDRADFFERLGAFIVPAWNRATFTKMIGQLQFVEDGNRGYLTFAGPLPFTLTLAVADGVVFASSQPGLVDEWERGGDVGEAFVHGDEFKRINQHRDQPVGLLVYLNTRSLIPLVAKPLNETVPRLYEALQLETLECAALVGGSSDNPEALRLAVGVKEVNPGLWRLLASPPSSVGLARVFPPDTTFVLQSSTGRASEFAQDLVAFAEVIDREITDEYAQERAEFKLETGFDPQSDFLANFVDAWAVGARLESEDPQDVLFVFRLGNTKTFRTHVQMLRVRFGLESTTVQYRGTAVEQATRDLGSFSYALVGDLLLVSTEHEAVLSAIDAIRDKKGLDRTKEFQAIRRRVTSKSSKLFYFNLAYLLRRAEEDGEDVDLPGIESIIESGTTVGLAVVPHERMIAFELVSSDGTSDAIGSFLAASISASLEQARIQSARMVSAVNVKNILTACGMYAKDHKKRWPPNLEVLVREGLIPAASLVSPYQQDQKANSGSYYIYRVVEDGRSIKSSSPVPIIAEPRIRHGGAVFGFADGHSEWITSPRADELIASMR